MFDAQSWTGCWVFFWLRAFSLLLCPERMRIACGLLTLKGHFRILDERFCWRLWALNILPAVGNCLRIFFYFYKSSWSKKLKLTASMWLADIRTDLPRLWSQKCNFKLSQFYASLSSIKNIILSPYQILCGRHEQQALELKKECSNQQTALAVKGWIWNTSIKSYV